MAEPCSAGVLGRRKADAAILLQEGGQAFSPKSKLRLATRTQQRRNRGRHHRSRLRRILVAGYRNFHASL